VTRDDLIAAGYREFVPNPYFDKHDRGYSKRVTDARGVRYAVHVRFWEFSKYSTPDRQFGDGWDAEVHFDGRKRSFVVTTSARNESVADIEGFFARVWDAMRPEYYEEYANDDPSE
jgi:hypothetical protein